MKIREKILVVDDNKEFSSTMSDILKANGYEVESENSGLDAIAKITKKNFDVVLLDIKMSGMNGLDTYKEIKKIKPEISVIMMTALPLNNLVKEALRNGAFGCLYKPLDVDAALRQIEYAIKKDLHILIVDDDTDARQTFEDVLKDKGYKTSTAATGKEAIRLCSERAYDVLFIDVKLPVLTGLDVYLAIRDMNPRAIAVLITAYGEGMKNLIDEAIKKGVYTCLATPLDMGKIVKWLEGVSEKIKNNR